MRTAHVCVCQCAQMLYTTQHRTVMIISPFIRQTIIIAKTMSTGGMRTCKNKLKLEMWANAQPDGRPAEHRWRPLFSAANFG